MLYTHVFYEFHFTKSFSIHIFSPFDNSMCEQHTVTDETVFFTSQKVHGQLVCIFLPQELVAKSSASLLLGSLWSQGCHPSGPQFSELSSTLSTHDCQATLHTPPYTFSCLILINDTVTTPSSSILFVLMSFQRAEVAWELVKPGLLNHIHVTRFWEEIGQV